MEIKGKLHRITNVKAFVGSYLTTGGNPTKDFTNWGKTRVHLVTDFPTGQFSGGFIPPMSFKTDTTSQGDFSFAMNDALAKFRGQIIAFQIITTASPLPGMPPIPILAPIYRSAVFRFSDISQEQNAVRNIYIFQTTTPTERGISQEKLDA